MVFFCKIAQGVSINQKAWLSIIPIELTRNKGFKRTFPVKYRWHSMLLHAEKSFLQLVGLWFSNLTNKLNFFTTFSRAGNAPLA